MSAYDPLFAARSVLQAFRLAMRARGLDPELGAVLDDGLAFLDEGLLAPRAPLAPQVASETAPGRNGR